MRRSNRNPHVPGGQKNYRDVLRRLAEDNNDEDVITVQLSSDKHRTLSDAYEKLIKDLLSRCTINGTVFLDQDARTPIVKINFFVDGVHICSVALQKSDLYLLAFGRGVVVNGEVDMYEFVNLKNVTFGLTRPFGLSVSYRTPKKFSVNGETLLEILVKIRDFRIIRGQDNSYIEYCLDYLMWVICEAARFTRIFYWVLAGYKPKTPTDEMFWYMSNTRRPTDLNLRTDWDRLIEAVVLFSQAKLDKVLKNDKNGKNHLDIYTIRQAERLLAVLRPLKFLRLEN